MKKSRNKALPLAFKPYLWSADFNSLDPEKDKIYVIHQVLSYGTLTDLSLLVKYYSLGEVRQVFITSPSPLYTPRSFAFLTTYILKISTRLPVTNYLRNVYGRTTGSSENQNLAKAQTV